VNDILIIISFRCRQ